MHKQTQSLIDALLKQITEYDNDGRKKIKDVIDRLKSGDIEITQVSWKSTKLVGEGIGMAVIDPAPRGQIKVGLRMTEGEWGWQTENPNKQGLYTLGETWMRSIIFRCEVQYPNGHISDAYPLWELSKYE